MTGTATPIKITTKEVANDFLNRYDTFLFDCDGVLWLGNHVLPHTKEFLDTLAALGKKTIFVTNNSTKSRLSYTKKFASFGITVKEEQIFTSGYASAIYVRDFLKLQPGKDKVWVFGETGISEELKKMGYESLGGADPRLQTPFDASTSPFLVDGLDEDVRAVIAGLDPNINYHKLAITLQYLQQKDKVHFVGTNVDSTFPQKGYTFPGAGSMIESIAFSSGRRPAYCGKPNMNMLNTIVSAFDLEKSKCCMVGDRLNTDMKFGVEGKLGGTLLVLSGIETEERALEISEEHVNPKFFAEKLGDIYELTKQ
ncbi:similar to Saccharomyces cerevisiae YDL236W PHO13 Alkaline phosphatase specific for p-nitrophenyl phosphate [Maudiozyma barnettii]|uniref:4-nitrophenylphosphatase n=1 Tax=Maudiozyma barnettii TaxID=61262 RepID=A0A8H2VID9_9SACH|nr:4-nitrophenylphosphatase [Kazachstania barnettii]CAB4255955.1 similar to Saccharomyces cerevisiae YDL236W PHO13 Alkaline phosphatase specific for p-nitrophenyl phosphate [Kazachstania barnettii]CAD1784515.1 similar to Saccharomyces cerevisiae YDL236W PHO13 Alkaline phosphatase specific for p-nitrophenyl phosphate [Kazachstania barnettii]